MCLILIGYQVHPDYPLVIAANRDEFFHRRAVKAGFWRDHPSILAGRDMEQGGTWMGVDTSGRIAAVTNYRAPSRRIMEPALLSRGFLVRDYLTGAKPARDYLSGLAGVLDRYDGFNLVAGDSQSLWFISTYLPHPRLLEAGIHGVGNGDLEHPWPKVLLGKARFARLLETPGAVDETGLFELLADRSVPQASPDPDSDHDVQRLRTPIFVCGSDYGTRCSTVLWINRDGRIRFSERSFDEAGEQAGTVSFEFTSSSDHSFP